jgi:hypothetical protein
MNFVEVFQRVIFGGSVPPPTYWEPPMRVLADRCERKTNLMLLQTGLPVTVTDLGNAGSLRKAIELAIEESEPDDLVYFCEDDYLHLPKAPTLLEEGIKRADYVTLYDHPDKYTPAYNLGEYSKVIKTKSSHWRYTLSTCMTFGVRAKALKEDLDVWLKHTDGPHPHDHYIFSELTKAGRRLAVCIPGVACHTDLEFSGRMNQILMEPWAIEMMIDEMEGLLASMSPLSTEYFDMRLAVLKDKKGWDRLVALDSLKVHFIAQK